MLNSFTLMKQLIVLLLSITLASSINLPQENPLDTNIDSFSNNEAQHERRTYDFNKLRHFLLTSNAEQRAAKREKQDFHKRELIREYLRSINDPDPDRLQEVRKRIKTFCNSYEDIMNSDRAACG